MPFRRSSGHGLRIAVIDSGVNLRHPHIIAAQTQLVALFPHETEALGDDALGHGTAVTAAIQEKVPAAEIYVVKLFGNTLRSSTTRLMQAIAWTLENRMDIVNLSLGTPNFDFRADFERLVAAAVERNVLLVSARSSRQGPVLPGILEGVAGVEVDDTLERDQCRSGYVGESLCFWASGYPRSLPGIPRERNLNGISFAVANLTGLIAQACSGSQGRKVADIHEHLALSSASLQPNHL